MSITRRWLFGLPLSGCERSQVPRSRCRGGAAQSERRNVNVPLGAVVKDLMKRLVEVRLGLRDRKARSAAEAGDAASARDQLAALLQVRERLIGAEHPSTLTTRRDVAYWTGKAGDVAGPATSSRRCCRCGSGYPAPSTRTP